MQAAVIGVHVLALKEPGMYQMAHDAAQAAAALLKSQPVSLAALTDNSLVVLLTPLLGLIPMDEILSQCDRDYLAGYLLQV